MPLITPKTDWIAGDSVGFSDMNRIEGNILYLQNENKTINGTNTYTGASTFNNSLDIIPPTTFVGAAMSIITSYTNGRGNYIEFEKSGYTVKGSVGALGNFEMNMSYNMDYADGVHRYYDSTKHAHWFTIQNNGYIFQYSPPGYAGGDDMWYNTGSQVVMMIDNDGKVACGRRGRFDLQTHVIDIIGAIGEQFKIKRDTNLNQSFALDVGGNLADYKMQNNEQLIGDAEIRHRFYADYSDGSILLTQIATDQIDFYRDTTITGTVLEQLKLIRDTDSNQYSVIGGGGNVTQYKSVNMSASNYTSGLHWWYTEAQDGESPILMELSGAGYLSLVGDSVLWEGVNTETKGILNVKYSSNASTTTGPSIAFINDAGQFSTRDPYTSSVIKSKHYSSANSERQSSLEFYTHSGGAAGSGSLTKAMEVYHDKVVFDGEIEPTASPTEGSWTQTNASELIPRGMYNIQLTPSGSSTVGYIEMYVNSTWTVIANSGTVSGYGVAGISIYSDGTNLRFRALNGTVTARYLKF